MSPRTDLPNPISTDGDGQRSFLDDEADSDPPENPPDLPPESYWVPKEYELDWFDRNAFIERKGSTKGATYSGNLNFTPNRNSYSSSLNSKSKASILGLPKSQKSCFADGNLRRNCNPENFRLFRTWSEPGGKSVVQVSEPGSPRVSCMGRVRSKKGGGKRLGIWASFKAIFLTGLRANRVGNKGSAELVESEEGSAGLVSAKRLQPGEGSESRGGNDVDSKIPDNADRLIHC
ncbi:hypothetical protein F0562_032078 [Nyssa sinensis]|uniref:Uncharacterized protein n=1 Tax=Nyssa sinensis TaxID=561372 RepID=A0A5J5AZZ1_9ASTE|nr:hypothetical protein F0562_032078 [Nyssa sinensis]